MIPILVAQVSTAGITFINTTMAGHAGADDLAGVSVGAGLFYPILASIIGLLMAGTPMMAQLLGQKKKEDLPLIVRTRPYDRTFHFRRLCSRLLPFRRQPDGIPCS